MKFPEGFWWGSGSSTVTLDGAAPGSDLAALLTEHPDLGGAGTRADGNGFAGSYLDDLALLAGHGLSHLRLTLDWTRLEPSPGHHDTATIEHLRLVLDAARAAGLSVWGCLHDGPLPGWFSHDEHGFADSRSRGYFWARHVEFVAETFGDLIHGWVPVYEPSRWATRGWLDGLGPPGRADDAEGFAAALEAVHLASVEAALRLKGDNHPVACAQWIVPIYPARPQPHDPVSVDAERAAVVVEETLRGSWLRMLTEETLQIPGRPPIAVPGARTAFDIIGLTYRHALAVQGDGALLAYPQTLPTGSDGQAAWTEGLAIVLHRLADALPDRELLIAGIGVPTRDEGQREQYLREILAIASEAVSGGIALRGLWWDTPIAETRGLFGADHVPRPAAALMADFAHGRRAD
ncbi:MAG: family 1 glycosylhydrolase [Aquihabitans sp.]